ncbi:substrate-binding domain-containing protein [Vallitalea guaymasensis]|uniref:substrate-binding domain-containing protein n=2 Tax=Vallitalea guaymasensis TaxID=1185412 RepID=UPI001930EBF4|nr:substrate-binding domain-containing protein [Vallitalea guaymasensis]
MKKTVTIIMILAMVMLVFAGCKTKKEVTPTDNSTTDNSTTDNSNKDNSSKDNSSKEDYEIAVVVKLTGIPFFNVMEEGVKKAAKDLGVNAYVTGATDADPALQKKIIEDLITTGVDAIVVVPNDATVLEPTLKSAQEKGILVIANESPGQVGADYDTEMIDNKNFAIAAAEAAAKAAGGEGQYVLFVGGLSVPLHNEWADLATEYLAENYPNMTEATDRIPCGEDTELSRTKTLELIKSYPDLKAIIGWGSLGPIGAAEALREKKMTDDIAVTGTVIPSQAAQYLADGSIDHGVLWNPSDSGYAAVYVAKSLLEGKDVESIDVPEIGKPKVDNGNVLIFDATLNITNENADSLGF